MATLNGINYPEILIANKHGYECNVSVEELGDILTQCDGSNTEENHIDETIGYFVPADVIDKSDEIILQYIIDNIDEEFGKQDLED